MNISLRRGERIFVNGAVIRVDRKVCFEFLNDVTFLLEQHIIQPEHATSPLKQLYLAIQTILMAPSDGDISLMISLGLIKNFLSMTDDKKLIYSLLQVKTHLESDHAFDALKLLRSTFQLYPHIVQEWDNQLTSIAT